MHLYIIPAVLICTMMETAQEVTQNQPKLTNVSHTEYESKVKMFLDSVKSTMQEAIHSILKPQELGNRGTVMTFRSKDIPRGTEYSLRMFITGATQATISQTDASGRETVIGTESLATGPRWVGLPVSRHPKEQLVFKVACGPQCQILDPKLNLFTRIQSGERAFFTDSYKCSANISDKEATCCLKHQDVNLRDIHFTTMEGPVWITFGYCVGKCPMNFNYATEHARLRHFVERSKYSVGIERAQDPCLPSKYGSIKILEVNEYDTLEIREWDKFYAKSCACY